MCALRCFSDKLMLAVADAADDCAIGTFFITFTKEVPSTKWMVRGPCQYVGDVA